MHTEFLVGQTFWKGTPWKTKKNVGHDSTVNHNEIACTVGYRGL